MMPSNAFSFGAFVKGIKVTKLGAYQYGNIFANYIYGILEYAMKSNVKMLVNLICYYVSSEKNVTHTTICPLSSFFHEWNFSFVSLDHDIH